MHRSLKNVFFIFLDFHSTYGIVLLEQLESMAIMNYLIIKKMFVIVLFGTTTTICSEKKLFDFSKKEG